jgi:hypothetical protein
LLWSAEKIILKRVAACTKMHFTSRLAQFLEALLCTLPQEEEQKQEIKHGISHRVSSAGRAAGQAFWCYVKEQNVCLKGRENSHSPYA